MRHPPNAAVRATFYGLALAILFGGGLGYVLGHDQGQGQSVAQHRGDDRGPTPTPSI